MQHDEERNNGQKASQSPRRRRGPGQTVQPRYYLGPTSLNLTDAMFLKYQSRDEDPTARESHFRSLAHYLEKRGVRLFWRQFNGVPILYAAIKNETRAWERARHEGFRRHFSVEQVGAIPPGGDVSQLLRESLANITAVVSKPQGQGQG